MFSSFDFNKTKDITKIVVTPFVSISWLLFIFLLLDLYNKIYIPNNVVVANSMVFICIETFWYTLCTFLWKFILSFYSNNLRKVFDFIIYSSFNLEYIVVYDILGVLIVTSSFFNTRFFIISSSFFIIFSIFYNKGKWVDNNIESKWELMCNNINDVLVTNNNVSANIYNSISKLFVNHRSLLMANNITKPVDIIIENNDNNKTILQLYPPSDDIGSMKTYEDIQIIMYNSHDTDGWEIINSCNMDNKLIKCIPNDQSSSMININSNLIILFNNKSKCL